MRIKNTIMNVQEHDDKAEGSLREKLKYVNQAAHERKVTAHEP